MDLGTGYNVMASAEGDDQGRRGDEIIVVCYWAYRFERRVVTADQKDTMHRELLACLSVDPKMADLDISSEEQDGLIYLVRIQTKLEGAQAA